MARESVLGTFTVALILCVVCSLLVSTAASGLKDRIEENKRLDIQKNVLIAAGVCDKHAKKDEILEKWDSVSKVAIKLGTTEEVEVADDYDAREARGKEDKSVPITAAPPTPGVSRREKINFVYRVTEDDKLKAYVLPIYGNGLWSTLYGFIALEPDAKTVAGITYYEDGETPGLGGEVNNDAWKAKWVGKVIYDESGTPDIELVKGSVSPSDPKADHQVDALSGATITSNGVEAMVNYWLGPDGFGPYLKTQQSGSDSNN